MRDWIRNYWWRLVRPRYEVIVTFGNVDEAATGIREGVTEGGALWVGFYLFESRARRAAERIKADNVQLSPQYVYVFRFPRQDEYTKVEIDKTRIA